MFGVDSLSAVNVTYPDKLNARPDAFREFNRMMHESVKYAVANADKVGAAMAEIRRRSSRVTKAWINDSPISRVRSAQKIRKP